MSRKPLAGLLTAVMVAALLVAPPPAVAQDGSARSPQPFDSTPVEPVTGAESAFRDAAPDWSGAPADPVGAAGSGDWSATDLSHAGSWTHGGSSGEFTYRYGMRTPPAAGPTPALALAYSSASHDGRTSGTNNQASWIGDGWRYSPSFVERSYAACAAESETDGNQGDDPTGDLCWKGDSPSITLALDGINTSLVRDDDSGQWRAEHDAHWRIQHLGSPASPGSASTERWVITTTDGTSHHFASVASSRWTVPVFGNHSGEPCYRAGNFKGSRCDQAYRWMLDKTVDVHGNLLRYTYQTVTGRYAPAADKTTSATYTREGWLQRIEYGLREGSSTPATAKVEFTVGDRCLSDCRELGGDPNQDAWPDTPWDLHCRSGSDCETYSPVFFSTKRLTKVATYVSAAGGFALVDSWALSHQYKDYGDDEQVVLWLASVQHTGHVGGSESVPPVEFGGTFLPNRVDAGEAWPGIWRPRLTSIKNETGGVTTINYSEPDCGEGDLPSNHHQNTRLCYPIRYTPEGLHEPVEAYFHKYVVSSVAESDATGGSDAVWTFFDYSTSGGGTAALWAWNDAEFLDDDDRDWNQWRGYSQVTTRVGDPADPGPQLRSRTRYFRGMDGDRLSGGGKRSVSVTDSQSNSTIDHRSLRGMVWETASYDNTTIIESTTSWYRWSTTAVRTHDGGKLEAFQTGPNRIDSRKRLSVGNWRHTRVEMAYDQYGRPVQVHEHGDLATTGDERCVRTTYTDNPQVWLWQSVAELEAVSVGCATTPQRPADVISAARAFYDGHDSHTATPSRGLLTRADVLDSWDAGPVYVTAGQSTYDGLGRQVTATDALGATTTTTYTPAGAGPLTQVVTTNPVGHASTARLQPAWGVLYEAVDANQSRTVAEYDPLGRRTAVWLPGRDPASKSPNLRFQYDISQTRPSTVATETMIWDESYLTQITLHDSLLRPRQIQTQTYGGRLISQTGYDSYGRVRFSSEPVFNNQSGPTGELVWVTRPNDRARTEYTYDSAGRVTDEAFVVKGDERWRTRYRYGGHDTYWMTTVLAPQGGTSTATLEDVQGRPVQVRQYHHRTATGEFDATSYDYQPSGQLARVTDPAGNQWRFDYDPRGRRVAVHDPDTGTSTTSYNAAGQPIATVDGNGTRLAYRYDQLGRPTQVWEGAAGSGDLLIERSYDAGGNGIGRPHTATRYTDGQAIQTTYRKYDPAGRPTQVFTSLPAIAGDLAGQYWQSYSYYPDGSPLTSHAIGAGGLAGEPMTYFYNELGQPTRVTSSGDDFGEGHVYVDAAVYSPYGHLLQRRLGDPDQVGGSSGQAWQTWIYEEGTDRIAEFYFDKDTVGGDTGNHGVAALSYEYDAAGNILSITDDPRHTSQHLAPETQCFQYDHLRRLTEAWAQAGAGECASTPNAGVVGGPGGYWSSYDFDLAGNRVAETRWEPGGPTEHAYSYPGAGQDKPHAVTEVTTDGGRTGFSYDAAGYTTAVDRDGIVQTLDWNPTGRLEAIETDAGTTRFFDDADGNRVLRIDPTGDITAWVAGYELTSYAGTESVRATRYYQHGGDVIAVRNGTGDIQWLAADHHGTNHWIVNGDTLTTKVRRYDPFGNERSSNTTNWPDQRGFVGGITNDEVDLTTIGAREYDPAFGRFLSRDPIGDFTDSQQVNGYSYASNNPVVFADPTGLRETECNGPCRGTGGVTAARTPPRPGGARTPPRAGGGRTPPRAGEVRNPGGARNDNGAARRGPGGGTARRGNAGTGAAKRGPDLGGMGVRGAAGGAAQQGALRLTVDGVDIEDYLQQQFVMLNAIWFTACSVSFHCPDFVRDNPPGAVGLCLGVSAGNISSFAANPCVWYTREDGIVYSANFDDTYGLVLGVDATAGLFASSAKSADEIAGGGYVGGVSAGELVVAGLSGGYSDAGDWTIGGSVGVGIGEPVGVHGGRTDGVAITHDDARSTAELAWDLLGSNPLLPQDPNSDWWRLNWWDLW